MDYSELLQVLEVDFQDAPDVGWYCPWAILKVHFHSLLFDNETATQTSANHVPWSVGYNKCIVCMYHCFKLILAFIAAFTVLFTIIIIIITLLNLNFLIFLCFSTFFKTRFHPSNINCIMRHQHRLISPSCGNTAL